MRRWHRLARLTQRMQATAGARKRVSRRPPKWQGNADAARGKGRPHGPGEAFISFSHSHATYSLQSLLMSRREKHLRKIPQSRDSVKPTKRRAYADKSFPDE